MGEYEIAATIGTVVSLNLLYHNHTFVAKGDLDLDIKNGFLVKEDVQYSYDFEDTEWCDVEIEVAGGELCLFTLHSYPTR